jgi:amino-acid N-acetyltransferase
MQDIPELLRLINDYAGKGVMLARTEFEIAENLRDFSLVEVDGKAAGCAALHFYSSVAGEVRSLAVDPAFQGLGAGRRLVEALEEESQSFGLASVFAFTYIPDFFAKLGFEQIDRSELPLKAWKDCMRCPKFQCCDEIAVVKRLQCSQKRVEKPPMRGSLPLAPVLPTDPVVLPILSKSH